MSRKRWIISQYNKDMAAELAENYELDPFLALLLVSRRIDMDTVDDFLIAEGELCDPFLLPDMKAAADRINYAIDNFEKIAVFGDYDADGITSTAIMYQYLEANGADVMCYIPDRIEEGYGITVDAINKIHEKGIKLIITVDNGISAVEETEYARSLNIDIVITDHHKQSGELPDAVAVVNPQRNDCSLPFKDWAGVGVAFKVICALENGDAEEMLANFSDLVAIGTLADVVPLRDENRIIVKEGLKLLNSSSRVGIEALREVSGTTGKNLTASGVAYTLAPRINAAGRMGSALKASSLLMSDDLSEALEIANEIDIYNKQRQVVENEITVQALSQLQNNPKINYARVIVVSGEGWHQGVMGIVAARLCSRFGKPAIVISTNGESGSGSCRSLEGFSIYDALMSVSDKLTHFGGHTLAAGFGIKADRIDEFRDAINEYAKTVEMPFSSINLDCKLNPAYINNDLLDILDSLEPCGSQNPEPCFGLFNMQITLIKPIGDGKHLRINLKKSNTEIQALLFSVSADKFPYLIGDTVDAAVKIVKNEFRGEIKPSVQIKDIRAARFDDINYLKSLRLYEKYRSGESLNEKEIKFITPDRNFMSSVYKFLKQNNGLKFDIDIFCLRANCPLSSAATVMVALDVFEELQLINKNSDDTYDFNNIDENKKVDLGSSLILEKLNSMKGE